MGINKVVILMDWSSDAYLARAAMALAAIDEEADVAGSPVDALRVFGTASAIQYV